MQCSKLVGPSVWAYLSGGQPQDTVQSRQGFWSCSGGAGVRLRSRVQEPTSHQFLLGPGSFPDSCEQYRVLESCGGQATQPQHAHCNLSHSTALCCCWHREGRPPLCQQQLWCSLLIGLAKCIWQACDQEIPPCFTSRRWTCWTTSACLLHPASMRASLNALQEQHF